MNKRRFLKSLLSLAAGLSATKVAPAARARELQLQTSPVAGFQFYEGRNRWSALRPGDRLTLRREPDNRYDPRAVEVFWNGHKLGYIPRADNAAIAQLMDRGERPVARIRGLRESRNPWKRVEVEVSLRV